jgi:hypothetical protein
MTRFKRLAMASLGAPYLVCLCLGKLAGHAVCTHCTRRNFLIHSAVLAFVCSPIRRTSRSSMRGKYPLHLYCIGCTASGCLHTNIR